MAKVSTLGLCVFVFVTACSGSHSSSTTTTSSTTRARQSPPTTVASPVARLRFVGDDGLSGDATDASVRCNFPDLEGQSIAVLAQPPNTTLLARISLRPGKVKVVVSSGSGPDYHERAFEGDAVRSFDAARGATVDAKLTEAAATAGSTHGRLGAITSIKGSVHCGKQTAGSSTIKITGVTDEGTYTAAALDPVRVECDVTPQGYEIAASGLVQPGSSSSSSSKVLIALGLTSDGAVTVDETSPAGSHHYTASGSSTIRSTGAGVRADVAEQRTTGARRTLHVEGNLSCGLHASG